VAWQTYTEHDGVETGIMDDDISDRQLNIDEVDQGLRTGITGVRSFGPVIIVLHTGIRTLIRRLVFRMSWSETTGEYAKQRDHMTSRDKHLRLLA